MIISPTFAKFFFDLTIPSSSRQKILIFGPSFKSGLLVNLSLLYSRSNQPSALSLTWLFNGFDPGCDPNPCRITETKSTDSLLSQMNLTVDKDNIGLYKCVVNDEIREYSNQFELTAHEDVPKIFEIDVPNGERIGTTYGNGN